MKIYRKLTSPLVFPSEHRDSCTALLPIKFTSVVYFLIFQRLQFLPRGIYNATFKNVAVLQSQQQFVAIEEIIHKKDMVLPSEIVREAEHHCGSKALLTASAGFVGVNVKHVIAPTGIAQHPNLESSFDLLISHVLL